MRVAIVNNAWHKTGVGSYIFELFRNYRSWRKNVEMLYLETMPLNSKTPGVRILRAPTFPVGRTAISNYFYFPSKLPRDYDIYHVSNETIMRCCKYVKPSVVTYNHCYANSDVMKEFGPLRKAFLKMQLSNVEHADAIITISNRSKNDFVTKLKIDESRIFVTHLGVDTEKFKPRDKRSARKSLGLEGADVLLLNVGLDVPRKNLSTLIKSVHSLRNYDPRIKLLRVGQKIGDRKLASVLGSGLIERIDVAEEELPLFYNAADMLVHPATHEGFGIPIIESMASGLPVIASEVCGAAELIEDEKDGILLPNPRDASTLAALIQNLVKDEGLAERVGKNAVKKARRYTWARTAKATWKIYERVYG